MPRFLLDLAWRDLRAGGRPLVVFALCLMLGVALVSAGGVLHRQLATALQTEVRALFGGDVEVQSDRALPTDERAWWAARGRVAEVQQLRTMLRGPDGRSQLVELMSADAAYPLVGELKLEPAQPLADALALKDGRHGIAVDPVLAQRLGLAPGRAVELGDLTLEVRALIRHQPDRSLRAEWRGAPVLVSDAALAASGLVQPASRLEHKLRVALPAGAEPGAARRAFFAAFPRSSAELRTVADRSDRIGELLGQVASGLLLVGFTALFIGGLGVFNSVQAYLQGKLATWATLRAVGLRDAALARLVLLQVLMLALTSSAVGVAVGLGLALAALGVAAERLPLAWAPSAAVVPALLGLGFGVMTALVFAWPAVARALSVSPAALFRGVDGTVLQTPQRAWIVTAATGAVSLALMLLWLPDARFGLAFVAAVAVLVLVLQGLVRLLAAGARAVLARDGALPFALGFELRVALAGVARPGSPMRPALLSLGTSLTLLVACTVVVGSLLRTLAETVPQQAPGLVFHDLQTGERPLLEAAVAGAGSLTKLETAPLVLGRVVAVNGAELQASADEQLQRAARDEHKLSHRSQAIDEVLLEQGAWWPAGWTGPPQVAMEDREAEALGLQIGDRLRFEIQGQPVEATLVAIYGQKRMQSRLWLEAMFSDGVLDPYVTREVGAAWLSEADAIAVQDRLAASAPHVVTVRTHALLQATRTLLGQAGAAMAVAAGACLVASLLVLASVVTASRARQVYEASVMHAVGARLGSLRRVLRWEYALLGSVTALFAVAFGGLLAQGVLWWRLDVDGSGLLGLGALVAVGTCALSLGAGAQWLLSGMKLSPARLLRGA